VSSAVVRTLDPTNGNNGKRRSWTPVEDVKLTEAVLMIGEDWAAVAAMVSGRTNIQCRARWCLTLDPANGNTGKPRSWTPVEDANLTEAVHKIGEDWVAVAVLVPGRTYRQCRERWCLTLDPANGNTGRRRSWKPEEDAKLTEAVHKLGKDWVAVAAMVPGRTNEQSRLR
jgi:hypothetical protein